MFNNQLLTGLKDLHPHLSQISDKMVPEPVTIDELLRQCANSKERGDKPTVFYPTSGTDYVGHSFRQLDVWAFRVAQRYKCLLPPRTSSSEPEEVVTLLGFSNLEFLISMFALSKLGYAVLLLSPRLAVSVSVHLLEATQSTHVFVDPCCREIASDLKNTYPSGNIYDIADHACFDAPIPDSEIETVMTPHLEPAQESNRVAWILHSSGTTGLPKPIYLRTKSFLNGLQISSIPKATSFTTSPLYHSSGMVGLFRSLYGQNKIYLHNPKLPTSHDNLLCVLQNNDIEAFATVPHSLKMLAASSQGIAALAKLKAVTAFGAACPDELGNRLVANGVNLITGYGS